MENFTASNGWTVTKLDDGQVSVARPSLDENYEYVFWLGPDEADVLREFFLAERDAELGRWRWPENPNYVVYGWSPEYIAIVNEKTGGRYKTLRGTYNGPVYWAQVANDYFDAHPVDRPWEDAQPGELWWLTTSEYGNHVAAVILTDRGGSDESEKVMFIPVDDTSIPSLGLRSAIIVTATRIHPEQKED